MKRPKEGCCNEDVTYTGKCAKDLPGCTCPEREPRCLQQSEAEAEAEGSDLGEVERDEEAESPRGIERMSAQGEGESGVAKMSHCFCLEI